MNVKDIKKQSNQIKLSIRNKRLHSAIEMMQDVCRQNGITLYTDNLIRLDETYRYMIHYMLEGVEDNQRQKVYRELIEDLYRINDLIEYGLRKEIDTSIYFSELRLQENDDHTLQSLLDVHNRLSQKVTIMIETGEYSKELMQESEQNMSKIFLKIWLTIHLQNDDVAVISDTLSDNSLSPILRSLIVGALFLALIAYFDSKKLIILLDNYQRHRDIKSLVAAIIIMSIYQKRVSTDTNIKDRIDILSFQDYFVGDLKTVIINLIKTRDTDRINKKMEEEVIPEIMKLQPKIINRFRNAKNEGEFTGMEENPEWQEILDKTGVSDKLKELSDMQLEGGDVMMVAFANLKHFSFFKNISNWFLPFDINHSELSSLRSLNNDNLLSLMRNDSVMCDSDKYSFALSIAAMPEMQRNMMLSQMDAQFAQLEEERRTSLKQSLATNTSVDATKSIRDIYRFFKLYRHKFDFYDPFKLSIDVLTIPFVEDVLKGSDIPTLVAEFYFTRGYYDEACRLFVKAVLQTSNVDDGSIFQKIGYCYQSKKNFEKALEYYHKSELISPDSLWLIKKMAACHRHLGQYENAISYYQKALEVEDNNLSLLMNIGHCFLESGNLTEALQYYYKVEYLDEKGTRALRPIAWCELITGRYDKSKNYYEKILKDGPSATDYMNYGHLYLLQGQWKNAVEQYKNSVIADNNDLNRFIMAFSDDILQLEELGFDVNEAPLLFDAISYAAGVL